MIYFFYFVIIVIIICTIFTVRTILLLFVTAYSLHIRYAVARYRLWNASRV